MNGNRAARHIETAAIEKNACGWVAPVVRQGYTCSAGLAYDELLIAKGTTIGGDRSAGIAHEVQNRSYCHRIIHNHRSVNAERRSTRFIKGDGSHIPGHGPARGCAAGSHGTRGQATIGIENYIIARKRYAGPAGTAAAGTPMRTVIPVAGAAYPIERCAR